MKYSLFKMSHTFVLENELGDVGRLPITIARAHFDQCVNSAAYC